MTVESRLHAAAADTNRSIIQLSQRRIGTRRWLPALAGAASLIALVVAGLLWQAAGTAPQSMARFGTQVEAEMRPTASLSEADLVDELVSLDGIPLGDLEVRYMKGDAAGTLWLTVADRRELVDGELPEPSRLYGFDGRDWWRLDVPYRIWAGVIAGDSDELWVSIAEGLAVFDGRHWVLHTREDGAPGTGISSAEIAPDGRLWVYSIGLLVGGMTDDPRPVWREHTRVSVFDGNAWRFWEPTDEVEMRPGYLTLGDTGTVTITSFTSWGAGSPGGIWTLDGDTWTQIWEPPHRLYSFSAITTAPDDEVWAAYREFVLRLSDGAATLLDSSDGIGSRPGSAINWRPEDLVVRGDEVWVGTAGGGISLFDGVSWQTFDESQGLPHRNVVDIEIGPGDELWLRLGEDGQRVVVFHP